MARRIIITTSDGVWAGWSGRQSFAVHEARRVSVHEFSPRVLEARDFVEVATEVCKITRDLYRIRQCAVCLHDHDGRPRMLVDNTPEVGDDYRERWVQDLWVHDEFLKRLRAHHAPVGDEVGPAAPMIDRAAAAGYTGADVHTMMLPILTPGALLGSIRVGSSELFAEETRRDLTTLSMHVSVRLTQLGIGLPADPMVDQLTARQYGVAQLAARGLTNASIAKTLTLSENTIKKHLKTVFDDLDVANRTELAARLARSGPRSARGEPGVTRVGEIAITRPRVTVAPR